ncbi:hypothetical protein SNE40_013115 [Patella caerulea]|uniref:Uncharacterized protein n=1 Tax=Patella caerulea TaxID=87958 RepID=A0AAN8PT80_PATCE
MKQSSILGFGVMTSTPKATQREIGDSSTHIINNQEAQAPLSEMRQNSMLGFSDMSATKTHPRETTDLLPHGTQQQENT